MNQHELDYIESDGVHDWYDHVRRHGLVRMRLTANGHVYAENGDGWEAMQGHPSPISRELARLAISRNGNTPEQLELLEAVTGLTAILSEGEEEDDINAL